MKSKNATKEFRPRTVAVKSLYAENVRLQKLCVAHRKQIRGMQKNAELLKAKYQFALAQLLTSPDLVGAMAQMDAAIATSVAPTTTAVEEHA